MESPSLWFAFDVSFGLCNSVIRESNDESPGICPANGSTPGACGSHVEGPIARDHLTEQSTVFAGRQSLLILIMESLVPICRDADVRFLFFSAPSRSSWVGASLWTSSPIIAFPRGSFGFKQLHQYLSEDAVIEKSQLDFNLWSTILETDGSAADIRLVILSSAEPSAKFLSTEYSAIESLLRFRFPLLSASYISLGEPPDSQSIQALHQFFSRLGGVSLPSFSTPGRIPELVNSLTRNFLLEERQILEQRKAYHMCRAPIITDSDIQRGWLLAKRLNPSFLYRECLARDTGDVKWRWMRGFRLYREEVRGVRDIYIDSIGPLGLEFSPPASTTPWWTLSATHPPSSSLNLVEGSVLSAVDGVILDTDGDIDSFKGIMSNRPLVLTFINQRISAEKEARSDWIRSCAEELSMRIIIKNSSDIYGKIPPNFSGSRARPWARIVSHGFDPAELSILFSATVMCDLEALVGCARINSKFRKLLFPGNPVGRKLLRYVIRRVNRTSEESARSLITVIGPSDMVDVTRSDLLMRATYGISIADIAPFSDDFAHNASPILSFSPIKVLPILTLIRVVTAASFVHSRVNTLKFISEGFPLELLFAEFMIRITLGANESRVYRWLRRIYVVEGPGSVFWLKLFLALIDQSMGIQSGCSILSMARSLSLECVEASTVKAANLIPISRRWVEGVLKGGEKSSVSGMG